MAVHEKWFISDTHFFHENILFFHKEGGHRLREEFTTIHDMHEAIVQRWNAYVKDNDYVYHLGDVTFKYNKEFADLMWRLKGKKRLILGNHDKLFQPKQQYSLFNYFEKVELWKGFKDHFTCTHIPLRLDSLRDGKFNVHGHTHSNKLDDPHYINVCVETRDYTPVHYDTILAEIAKVK